MVHTLQNCTQQIAIGCQNIFIMATACWPPAAACATTAKQGKLLLRHVSSIVLLGK